MHGAYEYRAGSGTEINPQQNLAERRDTMTHYALVFHTTTGHRRSLRITNPDPMIDMAVLTAAVDKLIANDIYEQSKGALDSLNRMDLTTVVTEKII
jgi:hypothetical protein